MVTSKGELKEIVTEGEKEFWEWPTSIWISEDLEDADSYDIVSSGIDVGSTSTQAVIMGDEEVLAYSNMRTGSASMESATEALNAVLGEVDGKLERNDIDFIVGTGYGRVNIGIADDTITEIACHGKGANYFYGDSVRTVLDMGGQDLKAIKIDGRGKVQNFVMNDKCAAGTGRGVEAFAELLNVPIEEIGPVSLDKMEEAEPVGNTCIIFAKTEASGLLRKGKSKEYVAAAFHKALGSRISELLDRVKKEEEFAITGGIAKNPAVVDRVEQEIKMEALEPNFDTQIAGAAGAAFFAGRLYKKQQN